MNNYIQPLENESFDEYKLRVYKMKQLGSCSLKWSEIAEMFGELFGIFKDESKWRKEAKEILISSVEIITSNEESLNDDFKDFILECKKDRVKLSDE